MRDVLKSLPQVGSLVGTTLHPYPHDITACVMRDHETLVTARKWCEDMSTSRSQVGPQLDEFWDSKHNVIYHSASRLVGVNVDQSPCSKIGFCVCKEPGSVALELMHRMVRLCTSHFTTAADGSNMLTDGFLVARFRLAPAGSSQEACPVSSPQPLVTEAWVHIANATTGVHNMHFLKLENPRLVPEDASLLCLDVHFSGVEAQWQDCLMYFVDLMPNLQASLSLSVFRLIDDAHCRVLDDVCFAEVEVLAEPVIIGGKSEHSLWRGRDDERLLRRKRKQSFVGTSHASTSTSGPSGQTQAASSASGVGSSTNYGPVDVASHFALTNVAALDDPNAVSGENSDSSPAHSGSGSDSGDEISSVPSDSDYSKSDISVAGVGAALDPKDFEDSEDEFTQHVPESQSVGPVPESAFRFPQPRFDLFIDGFAHSIRYHTNGSRLIAYCGKHKNCVLTRTVRCSGAARGDGAPLGRLMTFLQDAVNHADKESHFGAPPASFETRSMAREDLFVRAPEMFAFEKDNNGGANEPNHMH